MKEQTNEPSIDVFERVLRNEIHKNLFILDISVTDKTDLVIRGVDDLVRVMVDYYKMYKPEPSIQDDGLDEAAEKYADSLHDKNTGSGQYRWLTAKEDFEAGAEYYKQLNKR